MQIINNVEESGHPCRHPSERPREITIIDNYTGYIIIAKLNPFNKSHFRSSNFTVRHSIM